MADLLNRLEWLYGNLMSWSWICFNCWKRHLSEYRDVQMGDLWNCQAGKHWRADG